jgi:5-methylcytosine-specific restriction endonuclease McrA
MAHTLESRARAYEKMKKARAEWFAANGPCQKCRSSENLELDHVNPKEKVSHTVWSWTPARRSLELKKCQVLCRRCHRAKTSMNQPIGRVVPKTRKISDRQVLKAVLLRQVGWTVRRIAAKMKVSHRTIVTLTNVAMAGGDFSHRGKLLGEKAR